MVIDSLRECVVEKENKRRKSVKFLLRSYQAKNGLKQTLKIENKQNQKKEKKEFERYNGGFYFRRVKISET